METRQWYSLAETDLSGTRSLSLRWRRYPKMCICQHCIIMSEQTTIFIGVFCQLKDGSDKKWKIAKTICNIYIISSITVPVLQYKRWLATGCVVNARQQKLSVWTPLVSRRVTASQGPFSSFPLFSLLPSATAIELSSSCREQGEWSCLLPGSSIYYRPLT